MRLLPESSDRLFVLTGAGISAGSGLATFRGKGGLWEGNRAADLATPEAFARDPELVWRFYSMRRARHAECKPNAGYIALAQLEKKLGARMLRPEDLFAQLTESRVQGITLRGSGRPMSFPGWEARGSLRSRRPLT